MSLRIMLCLVCIVSISQLKAQEYPRKEVDLQILADQLFGFQELDLNYEELYENIALLLSNPVNINTANAEVLRFFNLLSEYQVQSLVRYRTENGPLLSVYELQAVPGFDLPTIDRIIPFVKVDDNKTIGSLWTRIRESENNYLILRYDRTLETREGFKETASESARFTGDETDLYIRFRTSKPGDFSFGFTIEKDAGEAFTWNNSYNQYGFDYNSFHAQLQNKGKLKNLIIGDFQTQFAQGLQLGGSFGYGKGSEAVMVTRRSNLGFLPYTSVNETGMKRGLAATVEITPIVFVSAFYASALRDATQVNDSSEVAFVSSFQTTGLHRNASELKNRHQIREQSYGVVVNIKRKSLDCGVLFNSISFGLPVQRTPQAYNQFTFAGKTNDQVGGFLNYTLNNFTFFSEAAQTIHKGFGITAGLIGSLTHKLDIALHYRNYQRNFQSLYGNAFSENSIPQNDQGIYWGWKYMWNKKISASGYVDLFRFPWLRYRSYAPSDGHEWLLRFNYQPSRNILMFVQIREESKVMNIANENINQYTTGEGVKRNYWMNCDYRLSPYLRLATRAQLSTYTIGGATTQGIALVQDISIDIGKLSFNGRYALFDTDDYDNRQYVYERDVWLAYTLPAYAGVGVRSYMLAQYTVNKHVSFWVRFARTRYTDRDEIGSGADTIEGNVRHDIRIQSRIKF